MKVPSMHTPVLGTLCAASYSQADSVVAVGPSCQHTKILSRSLCFQCLAVEDLAVKPFVQTYDFIFLGLTPKTYGEQV